MSGATELLPASREGILRAGELLAAGELVGIPTETVYGLAADARNPQAVLRIFQAKGRPADNPLIVHIADAADLEQVAEAEQISKTARKLASLFWPGPLTLVLPKRSDIPPETSAGLDTVGIRCPSHPAAREIIRASGTVLAAPSANLSGTPSPTLASHVMDDFSGRIAAVVDGGPCQVGLESTVVSFEGERVRLLRPGGVTLEQLREAVGGAEADPGVLQPAAEGERVRSPGMKYRHYSPKAKVVLVDGEWPAFTAYVEARSGPDVYALLSNREKEGFPCRCLTYGDNEEEHARALFDKLREVDKLGARTVYVRLPSQEGVGLAVTNRLLRAAGFEVVKV